MGRVLRTIRIDDYLKADRLADEAGREWYQEYKRETIGLSIVESIVILIAICCLIVVIWI